jgi:hypothetical protein
MSTRISELPPYTGATNPVGDMPISINGVTYRITPQLLAQTLQQVLDNNHDLINANNFQGTDAGYDNTGSNINGFGDLAAYQNSGNNVNAFGSQTGFDNTGYNVNAFGDNAALGNTGDDVNAFGTRAAINNIGSDVNAFGKDAGNGNQLSGQTIFSNTSMPSYATYAAAAADITTANGASAGSTYLFYNDDKKTIDAIRL